MLIDYGIDQGTIIIYCDNSSTISISKNPVQHSKTKHIYIQYHYIRELVDDKIVQLLYVPIAKQFVDILTKPLDNSTFHNLRKSLLICVIE